MLPGTAANCKPQSCSRAALQLLQKLLVALRFSARGRCTGSPCCLSPANGSPPATDLLMELRGLENANEHEDKSTPSANDLDSPTRSHRWENGVLLLGAVGMVPEKVTTRCIAYTHFTIAPWWVGVACGRAPFLQSHVHTRVATQAPRSNDQDGQGLNVHHDCRYKHPDGGLMDFPAGPTATCFTGPIRKLSEVHHDGHHERNLKAVEKVHIPRSSTIVHKACADVQDRGDNHRPTSGANEGWKGDH